MKETADKLERNERLEKSEYISLIENRDEIREYIAERARKKSLENFGNKIYIRGLVEFSNYCKNGCYYCGINAQNPNVQRYRLTKDEILSCCAIGQSLGFRTFVLQGGEDTFFSDEVLCDIVKSIKEQNPDCAITLSVGERSAESYKRLFDAGADRYLLRHETADNTHYSKLHPDYMSLENRKNCLFNLKKTGFQTGSGFMVGSPFQTTETLAEDLLFLKELEPHMIGIGPFVHHNETIFANQPDGSVELTLFLISVLRLMFPKANIPSTTALGTLDPKGREKGILSGANVLMPNLSPVSVRKKYALYDNKICMGEEAAECVGCIKRRVSSIGYEIITDRGDYK